MGSLLTHLASLFGTEVEALTERLKKDAIALSAVAFFVLVGVVFLLVALHAWFTALWGPIIAPLAIAGGALLVGLVTFVVLRIVDGIERRRAAERRAAAERTALVATAAITALPLVMQSGLMKKVGIPIGGVLAAAYLLTKPGRDRDGDDEAATKE